MIKSEKFSEIMQRAINAYLNGMLTNEEVIAEMLKLAKQLAEAHKEGEQLGLTADELAFYDALTKPQAIKDFYENEELIAITKELADTLRKNKTIDWQRKESARAKMRTLIKRLLKKHKYPPEGMDHRGMETMERKELFEWAKEIYGAEPDYPWNDWNCVLRHKNNKKWFAFVVEVNAKKLGLQEDKTVDVLNIKCDPMMIGSLRMKEGFFPAYHMNKENWISILLDGTVSADEIKPLLELSYQLTR